jgi:F-type H+-transporting ATPase subunit delta
MSENASIARPYAQAVFEMARESGNYEVWSGALSALAALAQEPQVSGLFAHPRVARDALAGVLIELCGDRLDEAGRNLVRLLARNRRLGALEAIAQQYELLRAEAERTIQAQVESALPVSDDHQQRIAEALEKRLGRRVELSVSTDASLIGGAVIRAGDLVIDGSVRARLEKLAAAVSG